jgi:hypothetical protein
MVPQAGQIPQAPQIAGAGMVPQAGQIPQPPQIAGAGMVPQAGQDEDEDGMRSTSKVTGQLLPSGWKAKDSSTTL